MSKTSTFPSADDIIGFLTLMEGQPANKREIARAFDIKGQDARIQLKKMLTAMAAEGLIEACKSKAYRLPQPQEGQAALPAIVDVRVVDVNEHGEFFGEPVDHTLAGAYPLIILENDARIEEDVVVSAQLRESAPGEFLAKILRIHEPEEEPHVMGVFKRVGDEGVIQPLSRQLQGVDFYLPAPVPPALREGNIVLVKPGTREHGGATPVEFVRIVSDDIKGNEAAIAIEDFEIPHIFPTSVHTQVEALDAYTEKHMGKREDLRHIPIVTIDGEDAKDFDDAVWAEAWHDEKHGHGHHILVAIADVAHYVREGSALDAEAFNRGNSVYFPGTVVPMLPERLSNDLCSLRPHEDRPVLAVHMYIGEDGALKKHRFTRAVIHSHARLTYTQAEAAIKGELDSTTEKVWKSTLAPLYTAYKALLKARTKRGALDLDVPETFIQFRLDEAGKESTDIQAILKRERLDAHRLIEEMMILANVAAATALETKGAPCLYRVHPEPGKEKLENLKATLKGFGIKVSIPTTPTPASYQGIIKKIQAREDEVDALMQSVLRSQEQARYDPENLGHFGLALQRYAHFTSPIRRYSDLVVHRHLIGILGLVGEGGSNAPTRPLKAVAEHLCITERRAQKAEWSMRDRLTVRFYNDFVGKSFRGKVATVTKFGLFVSVDDGVADGLLPYRMMDDDRYIFNAHTGVATGRFKKKSFRVGTPIPVTLIEADPIVGRLTFAYGKDVDPDKANKPRGPRRANRASSQKPARSKQGVQPKVGHKKKRNTPSKNKGKK